MSLLAWIMAILFMAHLAMVKSSPFLLAHNSSALTHSLHRAGFSKILPSLMHLVNIPEGISTQFTLFIPADSSIMLNLPRTKEILEYHVVPQRIAFQNLTCFPMGYRIPTLLVGRNIVVTSTRGNNGHQQRLTLDEVEVVMPDLYHDQFLVVHGLNGVLNPFMYGAKTP